MSTTPAPELLERYECNGFKFPDRDYYDSFGLALDPFLAELGLTFS